MTLEEALSYIDDCDEQTFSDAEVLINMLKENLELWKESNKRCGDAIPELDREDSIQKLSQEQAVK